MYEWLGILASCVVLASFVARGEWNIRMINIFGAALFVAYGIMIDSFSTAFLNTALIVVHAYKIVKKNRKE